MRLTLRDIKQNNLSNKRKVKSVQEGSGCFFVQEPNSRKSRRFQLRMKFPKGGNTVVVPLGRYGIEINNITHALDKCRTIREWSIVNERDPREYKDRNKVIKSEILLSDMFNSFMEVHKRETKEVTWKVSRNRLDQMLRFYGKDILLSDFDEMKGGIRLVLDFVESTEKRNKVEHADRCRRLLSNVFQYAISRGEMEYNPAKDKPKTGFVHKKKSNPTISWEEVPEVLTLLEENHVNASVLTQLVTKFYFLSGLRVSACVSLKWEWYDSSENLWKIPPETRGLKRKKDHGDPHLIPVSPEMKTLMNQLLEINVNSAYVFTSPEGKKYPHLNPETINSHLKSLLGQGRLTAHGWRDVIVTSGQEILGFPKDIILRQIGHTEHKQGASGAYDNTEFLPQRKDFLEMWSKELVNQGLKI